MSVLSISRRIRSCSAAVSTLAILHVALDGSELIRAEPSRADWLGSVRHAGGTGGLARCFHRAARASGVCPKRDITFYNVRVNFNRLFNEPKVKLNEKIKLAELI